LHAESSAQLERHVRKRRRARGPISVVRRVVKWTLLALGALTATAVALAVAGVGKHHDNAATGSNAAPARQAALAALAKLGTRSDPVPLRKPFAIGGGWRLKVVSAIPDDTQALLALTDPDTNAHNAPPPAGAQDFLASVTATYTGGGSSDLAELNLEAMGAHNAPNNIGILDDACGALPPPVLNGHFQPVFSGQSVTGKICWQIASNDAASLKLDAQTLNLANLSKPKQNNTWFALH
jgi:hypothetical protein